MAVSEEEFCTELHRRIVAAAEENKTLRTTVAELTQERDESREAVALLIKEKEQLHTQLNQTQDAFVLDNSGSQLGAQLAQMQEELEELTEMRNRADMLIAQLDTVQTERDSATKEKDMYLQQLQEFQVEAVRAYEELKSKFDPVKIYADQQEHLYHTEAKKCVQLTNERNELATQLRSTNAELCGTREHIIVLETENAGLERSVESYQSQLEALTLQEKTHQQELSAAKAREATLGVNVLERIKELADLRSKGPRAKVMVDASVQSDPPARSEIAIQTDNATPQAIGAAAKRSANFVIRVPPARALARIQASRPQTWSGGSDVVPYSTLPTPRRVILEEFPVILVPESVGEAVRFGRAELSAKLGGSMQGVDGTFGAGAAKPLAITHDLRGCIYPQRQTNPWLPTKPGQHGYMFVGLQGPFKDNKRFLEPTIRALFIPDGKSGWQYYGIYVIQRKPENDLSLDEWNILPDSFKSGKDGYCDTTLSKRMGKSRHAELVKRSRGEHEDELQKIRADYDAGILRVPCVVLQCVAYNDQLVKDLVEETKDTSKARLGDGSEEPASLGKRKRKTRDLNSPAIPSSSPSRPRLT